MISDYVINVFAYKCGRCGYIWIPRDADLLDYGGSSFEYADRYIMHETRPKCCARCKSKVWDQLPKRKRVHASNISKARVLLLRYGEHQAAYDLVPNDRDKDRLFVESMLRSLKSDPSSLKESLDRVRSKMEAGGSK